MKKLNKDLYVLVKGSLQGNTPQEKLEDVENRIFMNNMVDRWTKEDYELLCKFWPKFIAKRLTKFYQKSEKSNED